MIWAASKDLPDGNAWNTTLTARVEQRTYGYKSSCRDPSKYWKLSSLVIISCSASCAVIILNWTYAGRTFILKVMSLLLYHWVCYLTIVLPSYYIDSPLVVVRPLPLLLFCWSYSQPSIIYPLDVMTQTKDLTKLPILVGAESYTKWHDTIITHLQSLGVWRVVAGKYTHPITATGIRTWSKDAKSSADEAAIQQAEKDIKD